MMGPVPQALAWGAQQLAPGADTRVLPIQFQNGRRWRAFENYLGSCVSVALECSEHLAGSITIDSVLRLWQRVGGPLAHHRNWVRCSGIDPKRPHVHEHFTLCCVLEYLCCFDQVNVPGLLGAEVAARRVQLLESAYELSADKKQPDFFHADDFMGLGEKASGAAVSHLAERETSERLGARALIAKEIRKAREGFKPKKPPPHVKSEDK